MYETTRTLDDLREAQKARKQAPDRAELNRMFPGCERIEKNPTTGKEEWVVSVPIRDGKHLTKQGREFEGALRPFMAAEDARGKKLAARRPQPVRLKDQDGGVRLVAPHLADATARKNGWRSGSRYSGNPVHRGRDGMLFRRIAGEWEPLGVRCLGTPLRGNARVSTRGLQHDPDGSPWRYVGRQWVRL